MAMFPTCSQVPIQDTLPRQICLKPELIDAHVNYWLNHMPDLTDLPCIRHTDLQFWMKQKKCDRTKAHRNLKGLKAAWVNASVDFVISQNRWPVIFEDGDGGMVDLVDEFALIFWVSYVRHMVSIRLIFSVILCAYMRHIFKTHAYVPIHDSTTSITTPSGGRTNKRLYNLNNHSLRGANHCIYNLGYHSLRG